MAEQTFIRLKCAYDENNLAEMNEVLTSLEQGHFKTPSETINKKDKLKTAIAQLRQKMSEAIQAIFEIKQSEAYQPISGILNGDDYFAKAREELTAKICEMEGGW